LKKNLFSIGQAADNGCITLYTKNSCSVQDSVGMEVLKGVRENRLYKLEISVCSVIGNANAVVSTTMTSNLDDLMLWHHRLGHLNLTTIQSMHKDEMVEGLPKILKQPTDLFYEG
jgi:hypothetical protein